MQIAEIVLSAIVVTMLGLAGGFTNALTNGLRRSRRVYRKDGTVIWYPGWVGNVVIGGGAAFAFLGLGLTNPAQPQIWATAFLSGFAGARLINDLVEKQIYATLLTSTTTELAERVLEEDKEPSVAHGG